MFELRLIRNESKSTVLQHAASDKAVEEDHGFSTLKQFLQAEQVVYIEYEASFGVMRGDNGDV